MIEWEQWGWLVTDRRPSASVVRLVRAVTEDAAQGTKMTEGYARELMGMDAMRWRMFLRLDVGCTFVALRERVWALLVRWSCVALAMRPTMAARLVGCRHATTDVRAFAQSGTYALPPAKVRAALRKGQGPRDAVGSLGGRTSPDRATRSPMRMATKAKARNQAIRR